MAEATTPKTRRHITSITLSDGGAPAATYALPVHGDLEYTPGGYTLVESRNSYGAFTGIGPVLGTEQPTTFTITAVQRGLSSSDVGFVLKDFVDLVEVGTAANTTGTEPAGAAADHLKMWDVIVVFDDEVGTETLTFSNCTFIGSSYRTNLDDRNEITLTGIARQAYPGVGFA